ncbi:Flavin amine oxidase [Macleaya cordata]|uniref:Flavin amine oxidase n=1 Tax=Macleaya cordata TaxID=56857 RepID=A0A200QT85_MACCD|nr:Flavin amine oxidase [Macleaya cordata]
MNLILTPSSKPSLLLFRSNDFHKHHFNFKSRSLQTPTYSSVSYTQPENKTGVIIIGGGLAGLAAATRLNSDNIPFVLLEASDAVGGRVRTDIVDGFLLDRGFQIFITGYPEAQKVLDYNALDLQKFYSGAFVYFNGGFHTVADPVRHFSDAIMSLTNPIGSVLDKLLIGLTRIRVLSRSDEEILSANEVPIMDLLRNTGFSNLIIDRFFRPFFGGIFFDRDLETTSRLFDFIFKCLALGDNTLPAKGISAIPEQLANKLPSGSILLNSKVVSIDFNEKNGSKSQNPTVKLQSGEIIRSELGVIVAVEEPEAEKLLAGKILVRKKPARSTVCLYFSADRAPVQEPVLFLNGSGKGIVNNMFFATNVARSYGPPGKTLVSVSVIGLCEDMSDEDLTAEVVRELSDWFGETIVRSWKHLRTYRVGFAQPDQRPPTDLLRSSKVGDGIYVCGDCWSSASFDGALSSGRKAAEALLTDVALVSM